MIFKVVLRRGPNLEHGKHHLGYIEGMSPVVIGDRAIVLLHCQYPSIQHLFKHKHSSSHLVKKKIESTSFLALALILKASTIPLSMKMRMDASTV